MRDNVTWQGLLSLAGSIPRTIPQGVSSYRRNYKQQQTSIGKFTTFMKMLYIDIAWDKCLSWEILYALGLTYRDYLNQLATLQWRHNERDGVSNHQPHDCLLNRLFRHRSNKENLCSASLAFARGIHRWPVNSPHKGPVTRKMVPFDDVIMGMKN